MPLRGQGFGTLVQRAVDVVFGKFFLPSNLDLRGLPSAFGVSVCAAHRTPVHTTWSYPKMAS